MLVDKPELSKFQNEMADKPFMDYVSNILNTKS
jgi:hypothetical protein